MDGLFAELDTEAGFSEFVRKYFKEAPTILNGLIGCENVLDEGRIGFAYGEYRQDIEKFTVLLHSRNPDHYKRAGALLHALYQSNIITDVKFTDGPAGSLEDLESGFTRVSHGDAQHTLTFVDFYGEYYNQLLAFELAYRSCAAYEKQPRGYDFDYVRNVCHYLKTNDNLSVDSCFMLFKSLMT